MDGLTRTSYEELFTTELLSLAIALRTKFYQGLAPGPSASFISPCGLLYKFGKKGEVSETFTVKDVCDKIIHANTVRKFLHPEDPKPTTTLEGTEQRGTKWQLSFSVSLFIEGVLNWLDTQSEA